MFIPSFEQLREKALKLYIKPVTLPSGMKFRNVKIYLIKAERINNFLKDKLSIIKQLPKWEDIHPFYRELLIIGNALNYEESRRKVIRSLNILNRLWGEYRVRIKYSIDATEAKKQSREFVGRALSVVRRLSKSLETLEKSVKVLRSTPCINPNEPIIVVSGMPQTGKSTFVGKISTVKPVVSSYPFTTKNVILGHLVLSPFLRVQIMDTPGILDRPLSELNEIERKAIAAINHLATSVVFLIDPSEDSYYSLEKQVKVYQSVKTIFREENKITVVINKVDKVNEERLKFVINYLIEKAGIKDVMVMSALKGYGIIDVVYKVLTKLGIDLDKMFTEGKNLLKKLIPTS